MEVRLRGLLALYARLALASAFAAAVTDRMGVWGPPGTINVAWGDMQHFHAYAGLLNPWFPAKVIPLVGWCVTVAEALLALCLIIGFQIRRASLLSGLLLLAFAIGMTAGTGVKSALNASVLSASACALLLWQLSPPAVLGLHDTIGSAAAAWAVLFGAPHLWWALGVPVGFPGGRANHELMMTTWRVYFDVAVVGLSALAFFVALAPFRRWGQAIPAGVLRRMSWAASFLLGLRGIAGMIADGASDPVWWPTFLTGGMLFGATAFLHARPPRSSESNETCGR
jgi:thiosulfate dehydrogenase (quinone) large subunit